MIANPGANASMGFCVMMKLLFSFIINPIRVVAAARPRLQN